MADLKIGIISPPLGGKKTFLNFLGAHFHTQYENIVSSFELPDENLTVIKNIFKSKKEVYPHIEFHLLPSFVKDSDHIRKLLVDAREYDALIYIYPSYQKNLSPEIIKEFIEELTLSDLVILENRLHRIEKQLKSHKREELLKEKELLNKIKNNLENNIPVYKMKLNQSELKILKGFSLLNLKPLLIINNCNETDVNIKPEFEYPSINIPLKTLVEISQLSEEEQEIFKKELGVEKDFLKEFVNFLKKNLEKIIFYTANEKEARAYLVNNGITAYDAAGIIHSDFQKGFIKAEVVNFEDIKNLKDEHEIRKNNLIHIEGKEYIVQNNDIIKFRFNV